VKGKMMKNAPFKFNPIVRSLLENDLYKFTMCQALLHSHPEAQAEYRFVCRNETVFPLALLKEEIEAELDHLCTLKFKPDELEFLAGLRYIKSDFVDFLSIFQFQRRFISVEVVDGKLNIVAKGPIIHIMGFEIFVLYIVNELYFRRLNQDGQALTVARERLNEKIAYIQSQKDLNGENPFIFFDFGLRRRFSRDWHEEVVKTLKAAIPDHFRGTSNVYLAKTLGLTPIGTMAHEYLQAFQGFGSRLRDFQKAAFESWVQEYRGDLGIALTDVVGMDAFLEDFDLYFAKLFDGLRHDSGEPISWGEKALVHYQKLKIDAKTKTLVFSDGLNIKSSVELYRYFKSRIKTAFGIGTNLINDTPFIALNIVMKIVNCNGQSVAKLPDSAGKTLCDDKTYLDYLSQLFKRNKRA
jgi:nicotinate phosphoribosyltransferase